MKHEGVMYRKGGMKTSGEWRHVKSCSGNFTHSLCTRDLLLSVFTLLSICICQEGTLSCFLLMLKYTEALEIFNSKIRAGEQSK